jgi:rod shape-determining protein MreC
LSRRHVIVFISLVVLSIIPFFLREQTKLALSVKVSSALFFPIKVTTEFFEFLSISSTHIEELETMINRLKLENAQLRKEISQDTTEFTTTQFTLLKAQIIGRDPSNINGYLYVDKGTRQRVAINQPVLAVSGLIGAIAFVDEQYSIVETLENPGFAVSGVHEATGVHGVVKQRGGLLFDYVKITDDIHIGDSIHTSGMSEIFPRGIVIGSVKRIKQIDDLFFKPVYLEPSVRINRLTSVYILVGGAPRDRRVEFNWLPQ